MGRGLDREANTRDSYLGQSRTMGERDGEREVRTPQPERDEVHLWWARPRSIIDPDLLAAYRGILNEVEAARHQRFMFGRHRHLFLVARALVRVTLSRYSDVQPAGWRFTFNEHGRPDIHPDHGMGDLQFNLSHTDGMAILAIARRDVGVDVENITRRTAGLTIADHFFAAREVAALREVEEPLVRSRFFDYWTLKEAYIKARGMGLALPLGDFAYSLGPGRRIGIGFSGTIEDDPQRWRFRLLRPTAEHRVALAQRIPGDAQPLTLRCFQTVPLISATAVDVDGVLAAATGCEPGEPGEST